MRASTWAGEWWMIAWVFPAHDILEEENTYFKRKQ
jgi:hypothetical protein